MPASARLRGHATRGGCEADTRQHAHRSGPRRGDALYAGGLEPPLDDPAISPLSTPSRTSCRRRTRPVCRYTRGSMPCRVARRGAPEGRAPRVQPAWPSAAGDASWLTSARDGHEEVPGRLLPGSRPPDGTEHLVSVYLDIVRRYGVDGIHFDYIRYPETEGQALPRGADVGYNPVSVARFQRATGRQRRAGADDEAWTRWRRQQVTQLVRRHLDRGAGHQARIKKAQRRSRGAGRPRRSPILRTWRRCSACSRTGRGGSPRACWTSPSR